MTVYYSYADGGRGQRCIRGLKELIPGVINAHQLHPRYKRGRVGRRGLRCIKGIKDLQRKMNTKQYQVILDDKKIGVTNLENGDAPMGVVFGELMPDDVISVYAFLKAYCLENKIETRDYPEDRLISTSDIPQLRVVDSLGSEIKGLACSISEMDSDIFEIEIIGIPYPFYEEEFPHHVKAYNELFRESS